ncbi:hypothetical protein F4821DRAFT_277482 [Hypoxylon rubiginosum]|uniref:Uncharacterized protein n=1 Tax=Hypoxylon rubiginosum TaxID=110542 RepID=A0ACC0D5F4_9PEZI|nr:hypothetical protein F4821DRAFT_277482 [Hypoxylon rubiginosum]
MDPRDQQQRHFPLELVFQVMTCLLPTKDNAIIPQSHPATKVLVAFLTVSRATYREAVRQLKKHCIYLGHHDDIFCFINCLRIRQRTISRVASLPSVFQDITSMYLYIDDARTTCWAIMYILIHTGPTLKRLTVETSDEPFMFPGKDIAPTAAIQFGLEYLTKIEELITNADFFYMFAGTADQKPPPLFTTLKRLALMSNWVHDNPCWYWPLVRFPAINHIVLKATCIFRDYTFPPELVDFREQHSIGPVKIVLPCDDGPWKNFYCPCKAYYIEREGGDHVHVMKQLLSLDDYDWWKAAVAGEIWDWGDDHYASPMKDLDCGLSATHPFWNSDFRCYWDCHGDH